MTYLKPIKSISARKISKSVKQLSQVDLSRKTKDQVALMLKNSFKFPYNTFTIRGNVGFIYRASINTGEQPYTTISRIAFNPDPQYIERANLKHKEIAYGANALDISAIECCQNELRTTTKREFYLTIGKWAIASELNSSVICHSKYAQSSGTYLYMAYESLTKYKINEEGYRKKQLRIWNLINKFFADHFAKKLVKSENDYLFTAIYSNTIFKSQDPLIDCIMYPSHAYHYVGFNYAYKPDLVRQKRILLISVHHVKISFNRLFNQYPKIEVLKETSNFSEDTNTWE